MTGYSEKNRKYVILCIIAEFRWVQRKLCNSRNIGRYSCQLTNAIGTAVLAVPPPPLKDMRFTFCYIFLAGDKGER